MTTPSKPWDAALVRTWLERRLVASRLDQAAADRRGYDYRDDYDQAAAEEYACRALADAPVDDQVAFAKRIKDLIAQDEYRATGLYDDARFERHVRAWFRKVAKMTKANEGFDKTLRRQ
ncbi:MULTISPECIES: hypothetical protein [unclassified Sphingomonas]|uniref:hypothetical protein n=1 Tax=unclassified Sphingomonas TaxID=196159 RepID=UPI002150D81C|nr:MULTISPECIES: hypothetical protein [unclassified Sphingomonas]MCR5870229.1 hypothetical protein [Sphingomonas sp. J344]UUX98083.1 hypothetical protein LRS08_10660 [Sphingomonas sp. J315]